MSNFSNYLNKNEFILRFKKSKNNKELSNEEKCLFQLISNKKKEFIPFFSDFFINLPGFLTIYKDKFFSKIKEYINDKHYINTLKNKCHEISKNYKYIDEFDEKYLGNKRKREKSNNDDDDEKLKYDNELKLLESDYPNIENNNDSIERIKVEKIEDEESTEIISSKKKKKLEKEDKYIILENISKKKNNEMNLEKINDKINNESNLDINNSLNLDVKEIKDIDEGKKSKKQKKDNKNKKKKKIIKDNIHIIRNELENNKKYLSPTKVDKDISKINQKDRFFSPKYSSHFSSFEELNFGYEISSNDDLFMSEISEYSNKLIPAGLGINSRLDKMPKINIIKKKKSLENNSSEKLLYGIKEKLLTKNIVCKSKQNSKKKNSEDSSKIDRLKLKKIVNNNFYGQENNKSNNKSNIENVDLSVIDNVNKNNNNIIVNEVEMKEQNEEKKNNVDNNINENKKEKQKTKKKENNNQNNENIQKSLAGIVKNENIIILNTFLLEYNYINGEKIIQNSIEIPNSIIIQKSALKSIEIPYSIIIPKNLLNMDELNIHFSKVENTTSKKENKNSKIFKRYNLAIESLDNFTINKPKEYIEKNEDKEKENVLHKNSKIKGINSKIKKEKKDEKKAKKFIYRKKRNKLEEKIKDNIHHKEKEIKEDKIKDNINHKEKEIKEDKILDIDNNKSNCSKDKNNISKKEIDKKNVILQEKSYIEEDYFYQKNTINNNKNEDGNIVDNNEDNINTTDVLNCFNYLYQQKSQ